MKVYILLVVISLVKSLDAACSETYEWGVSRQEQDQIVNLHNNFRTLIAQGKVSGQPRGINLKRMKWDDALGRAAQDIANSCEFAHKSVSDSRWGWVGQNLYGFWSTSYEKGADWNSAVNAWTNEHNDYTYGSGFSTKTGHYTQVVWADSDHVGCGYTYFRNKDNHYEKFYVCNYGPGGNWQGQNPYETGTSGCENLC